MQKKAVILLSGGVDSTTCLAYAKDQDYACYALTYDYGQRNAIEIQYAKKVANHLGVVAHRIVKVDMGSWGGSALTDSALEMPTDCADNEIPMSYVPARNTIFLSIAMGYAEAIDAHDIFVGMNAADYAHYPDCRPEYLEAFTRMANLATREGVEGRRLNIHTPLIEYSKKEIVALGRSLGVDYSETLSCYDPDKNGQACHVCEACQLREAVLSL
ncbi:MAG: 7-cyano-7-deazaguanine synthase QueC [Gammaproteobacteria bacterium]|nr:7-cyano-7-deazaguanine synthase QueC [Gammaproteobacteria bacterium]MCH9744308.1 7-cyano-7-deazaguanine synthase QueC [Gammaproteobacteria bacterium]